VCGTPALRCVTRHGHSEHTSHFVPVFYGNGSTPSLLSSRPIDSFHTGAQSILPLWLRTGGVLNKEHRRHGMWIEPKETSGSLSLIRFLAFIFQLYYPPPHHYVLTAW
jgi:hypothetical protein